MGPWHVAAAGGSGNSLALAVLAERQCDQPVSCLLQDGGGFFLPLFLVYLLILCLSLSLSLTPSSPCFPPLLPFFFLNPLSTYLCLTY